MIETVKNALEKYFKILSKTGYRKFGTADYLVILTFLQELTEGKYSIYLDYNDIRSIIELLRIINDSLCEYCETHDINYKDFLEGHWYWINEDLWLNPQIYIGDLSVCGKCML